MDTLRKPEAKILKRSKEDIETKNVDDRNLRQRDIWVNFSHMKGGHNHQIVSRRIPRRHPQK
jgi:hypothetical protein